MKKNLIFSIIIFFLFLFTIRPSFAAYDQFEGDLIDISKWVWGERVREVSEHKLRLVIGGSGQDALVGLSPREAVTSYFGAKVQVESGSRHVGGSSGRARLAGFYYNDSRGPGSGQDYNGYEGNIWAQVLLYFEGNVKIAALAKVVKTEDANDTVWTTLFSQEFKTVIKYDTEYKLSIEFTNSKFIFKCNSESLNHQVATPKYDPYNPYHSLTARLVLDIEQDGYIMTSFDDVYINSKSFTALPPIQSLLLD